jgi:putative lipoic acid-binding regulatory protein
MSDESVIQFPCEFPIKMMGRDTPEFRAIAVSLVENHVGPLAEESIQINLSAKGNFVSVTVTVTATSQQQLDDIYRDVSGHEDVLMAL